MDAKWNVRINGESFPVLEWDLSLPDCGRVLNLRFGERVPEIAIDECVVFAGDSLLASHGGIYRCARIDTGGVLCIVLDMRNSAIAMANRLHWNGHSLDMEEVARQAAVCDAPVEAA